MRGGGGLRGRKERIEKRKRVYRRKEEREKMN